MNPNRILLNRGYTLLSGFNCFPRRTCFSNDVNLIDILVFSDLNLDRTLINRGFTVLSGFRGFLNRTWCYNNNKQFWFLIHSWLKSCQDPNKPWLHRSITIQAFPQEKIANPYKILTWFAEDQVQMYPRFSLGNKSWWC